MLVCYTCGTPDRDDAGKCPTCGRTDFISAVAWRKKQEAGGGAKAAIARVAPHMAERLAQPLAAEAESAAGDAQTAVSPVAGAEEAEPTVRRGFRAELYYVGGAVLACVGLWLAFPASARASDGVALAMRAGGGVGVGLGVVGLALGIWDTVQSGAMGRRGRVALGALSVVVVLGLAAHYINPAPGVLSGHDHSQQAEAAQPFPEVQELGNPNAKVRVEGIIPQSECFAPAIEAVRDVAEKHPDDVYVQLYAMGSDGADELMAKYKQSCAGFFINGSINYALKLPDGSQMDFHFAKSPGDEYSTEQLEAALTDAIGKAATEGGGDTSTAKPPAADE